MLAVHCKPILSPKCLQDVQTATVGGRMNRSGVATLLEAAPLLEKSGDQNSVDVPDSAGVHSNPSSVSFPMFLAPVHLLQA